MATPVRLLELRCPKCNQPHWEMDNDFRGIGGKKIPYPDRTYACCHCRFEGEGYTVLQGSPPEFIMQPHPMYPMSKEDFAYWLAILKREFPKCARLDSEREFVPFTPEEYEAKWPKTKRIIADGNTIMQYMYENGSEFRMIIPGEEIEHIVRAFAGNTTIEVRVRESASGPENVIAGLSLVEAFQELFNFKQEE